MQARDAGNAAADATWNAVHNGVKEFTVSASDLTDDAKFTCILATVWTRYWRKSGRSGWDTLMSVSIQRTIRYPWQCTLLPTTTSAYRVFWIGWTRRSARRMRRQETSAFSYMNLNRMVYPATQQKSDCKNLQPTV